MVTRETGVGWTGPDERDRTPRTAARISLRERKFRRGPSGLKAPPARRIEFLRQCHFRCTCLRAESGRYAKHGPSPVVIVDPALPVYR